MSTAPQNTTASKPATPKPFFINVFRDRRGALYTLQANVVYDIHEAARDAEDFAEDYEHTVTEKGITYLQDMFSEKYQRHLAANERTDALVDSLRDLAIIGMGKGV